MIIETVPTFTYGSALASLSRDDLEWIFSADRIRLQQSDEAIADFAMASFEAELFTGIRDLVGGDAAWCANPLDGAAANRAGCSRDQIAWLLMNAADSDWNAKTRCILWLADCVAHTLTLTEQGGQETRIRDLLDSVRAYPDAQNKKRARERVMSAQGAVVEPLNGSDPNRYTYSAAINLAYAAIRVDASWRAATWTCIFSAANRGHEREYEWQMDRLVQRLSPLEVDDWSPDPMGNQFNIRHYGPEASQWRF